jgi:acyl-CoA hydrolase
MMSRFDGQVNAEQSGARNISAVPGPGRLSRGQFAAARRSVARDGQGGKVLIAVALSGPVTTARSDVDVIVTEFGAAELKGQTLAERARRLVGIAHPDFREELDKAAHAIQQRGF